MVQTVRHFPFFMSLKITFSHNVFYSIIFFYLIKVEHPSTKLQVLPRSARLEGTNNTERGTGKGGHISSTLTSWGFQQAVETKSPMRKMGCQGGGSSHQTQTVQSNPVFVFVAGLHIL